MDRSYMPGLAGLRALAVFAVIAYHLDLPWVSGGLLGVNLFFVLSGYLITNILLNQSESCGFIDLKDFWLRRARRLLPALVLVLISVLLWMTAFAPDRLASLKPEVLAAAFYASNWYLIFHDVSYFEQFGPPSPLGHLWSLAIEEQFYLLWPFLLGFLLRFFRNKKWIIVATALLALVSTAAMALIYVPGQDPSRVYYGTDTRAFALLAGALLAMFWPRKALSDALTHKRKLALEMTGAVSLLIVLWMIFATDQYQNFLYQGGLLLFSVATACLVAVLAHPASRLGKLFGTKPLRWLGDCSYGIYLWHYPVIVLTSPAVDTGGLDLSRSLAQVLVCVLLAALSLKFVENPIRYGSWRQGKSSLQLRRHRRRSLWTAFRVSASTCAICLILLAVAAEGTQTLAIDEKTPEAPETPQFMEFSENPTPVYVPPLISEISGDRISVIGDSLMLGVEPFLEKRLPGIVVDAKKNRQMRKAPDVISGLKGAGNLREVVILELGTNGPFTEEELEGVLFTLADADRIILMNARVPRQWEAAVNETLVKVAAAYPKVLVADWYSESGGHDEYFYPDGVHVNPTGAKAYCDLIIRTLNEK